MMFGGGDFNGQRIYHLQAEAGHAKFNRDYSRAARLYRRCANLAIGQEIEVFWSLAEECEELARKEAV